MLLLDYFSAPEHRMQIERPQICRSGSLKSNQTPGYVRRLNLCASECPMRVALVSVLTVAVFAIGGSAGRAQVPGLPCHGAQQPKQVAELLFGRDVGHRIGVSEGAFAHFAAGELAPRFPTGLTITDAIGQWRDPAGGAAVREATKRVEIVLPGNADDQAKLDAVVTAYKREFHQRSVGVIVRPACVSF
jgi:Protein of unknown function (DUF3574)